MEVGQDHHRNHHLLSRHRSERRRQRKQHAGEQLEKRAKKGPRCQDRTMVDKKKRRGPTGASKKLASNLRL